MTTISSTDTIRVIRNQDRPELFVTSWMSHEHFRTYHVLTARKLGSVNASILLSDLVAYYKYHKDKNLLENHIKYGKNWTPYSFETCEERTALSRKEQDTALSVLIRNGLIEKEVFGVPGKRYFRINFFTCEDLMLSNNVSRMTETDKVECPKGANCNDRNGQSNICNEMSYEMLRDVVIDDIPNSCYVKLTENEKQQLISEYGRELVSFKIMQMEKYCQEKRRKPYVNCFNELKIWCEKHILERDKTPEIKQAYETMNLIEKISQNNPQLIKQNIISFSTDYLILNNMKGNEVLIPFPLTTKKFIEKATPWMKNTKISIKLPE